MTDDVYAVVGGAGSGHSGVALDLAGAMAAGGVETVLVELSPGPPHLLDALDLGLEFVFRSTTGEVLSGSADPAGDVTPVAVADSGVDSLGVLPSDPGGDRGDSYSLEGIGAVVDALREVYDVVVLDVGTDGVADLAPLEGPAERAVVTTGPDAELAREASRLAARLESSGVAVEGAVVTDCTEESELWAAKSRLDRRVLAVVPPVRPDRVDVVGDRIRTLREALTSTDAIFSQAGPEVDEDAPVRSLLALVRGDPRRATIAVGDDGEGDPGASEGHATTRDAGPGGPSDPATFDPPSDEAGVGDAPTGSGGDEGPLAEAAEMEDAPADPNAGKGSPPERVESKGGLPEPKASGGSPPGQPGAEGSPGDEGPDPGSLPDREREDPRGATAFEFGELPSAANRGGRSGGDPGDGDDGEGTAHREADDGAGGEPGDWVDEGDGTDAGDPDRPTESLVDRISDILDGREPGDSPPDETGDERSGEGED